MDSPLSETERSTTMKLTYQSVIVFLLAASLSACLMRDKNLPEVQPFAEGPWGRTIQEPPPPPATVTVYIPKAEKEKKSGLFSRKPKPAPEPDAAERPQVERLLEEQAATHAAPESEKKFGLFNRKKEPEAGTLAAPEPAPAITEIPATAEVAVAPQAETEKRFGLFNRKKDPKAGTPIAPEPESIQISNSGLLSVEKSVSFVNDIKPIFQEKCVSCHNRDTLHGRVSLESRELAFQNGPAGAFIVPGNPEASILFQNVVTSKTKENAMPPVGHRVTRQEKNTLYAWIMEGADWPDDATGRIVADVTPRE